MRKLSDFGTITVKITFGKRSVKVSDPTYWRRVKSGPDKGDVLTDLPSSMRKKLAQALAVGIQCV